MILPNRDNRGKYLAAIMAPKDYVQKEPLPEPAMDMKEAECRDCMRRFMQAIADKDVTRALDEMKNLLAVLEMEEDD
jgi:trehalose-6-phosphate synthase